MWTITVGNRSPAVSSHEGEDRMGTTVVEGRTRWQRFAVVLALSLLAAGVLMVGLANGAIGASFALSGSSFKISASQLRGSGFA